MSDIDRIAEERLAAEETIVGSRKLKVTLRQTGVEFWKHPTPWMIAVLLLASVGWRVVEGDWRWSDLLGPLALVVLFPFIEWTIHVFVLHYRPRKVAGRMLDYQLARDHRRHHADPRDIPLVFIPWQSLAVLAPVGVTIALVSFPRLGQALSFIVASYVTLFVYEWTHYLIHSDYKAKSAFYRAIWRNHRLHHYKNEHYWFGVATSNTSDRFLGTSPDPATVAASPTAKNLHGS
jgi:hypothetical protein